MGLRDITRSAVMGAIDEYDRLGQDEFLDRYGFDRARSYLLIYDGKAYDSKAIVGRGHGLLPGERAMSAREFSGGEATVGRLLRGLGFTVQVGDLAPGDLVTLLTKLNVYRSDGLPALYQPITLLWAFARARRGASRGSSPGKRRSIRLRSCSGVTADRGKESASTIRWLPSTARACGSSIPIQAPYRARTAAPSRSAGSTRISRETAW